MMGQKNCQSCGMPMVKESDFGTNANGSSNDVYCQFCFHDGNFTEPDITMEQMIEKIARFASEMNMTEFQARSMAKSTIPGLKRWKTKCL